MSLRFRNTSGDEYTRTTNLPATSALTVCTAARCHNYKGLGFMFTLAVDGSNYISFNWGTIPQNMSATCRIAGVTTSVSVTGRSFLNTWLFAGLQREASTGTITAFVGPLYGPPLIAFSTSTAAPTGNFTPDAMAIGDHTDFAADELDGELSCMRIWTSVLSRAELERERQAIASGSRRAVCSSNLHADYPFIGSEYTKDVSPNGYDLTAGTAIGALDPFAQPAFVKRARRSFGITASGSQTVTPSSVVANWALSSPTIVSNVSLTPAAVIESWSVPATSLDLTIPVSPTTASWNVPSASTTGSQNISAGAVPANWNIPAPTLVTPAVVVAGSASAAWALPSTNVVEGAVTLTPAAAVANWVMPAITFQGGDPPDLATQYLFGRRKMTLQ